MAEIWLLKTPTGFEYSTEEDKERGKRFKIGDYLKAEITKPRNAKHHRLGMKILRYVFEHQNTYHAFESFLIDVKIATGHVVTHISQDGNVYYIPKSISFEAMDEIEFADWKREAVNVIFNRFIPHLVEEGNVEDLLEKIILML